MSQTQLGLDPECKWTEAALAQKLGVIQQTINSWISDIRARHRASRKRASEIIGNTNFSEIDTLLSQGHDMDYIARHYHMDLALARRIPGTPYSIRKNVAKGIYYFLMAGIARVVVPGLPHHITQRGNRRQETFFVDDDFG